MKPTSYYTTHLWPDGGGGGWRGPVPNTCMQPGQAWARARGRGLWPRVLPRVNLGETKIKKSLFFWTHHLKNNTQITLFLKTDL